MQIRLVRLSQCDVSVPVAMIRRTYYMLCRVSTLQKLNGDFISKKLI